MSLNMDNYRGWFRWIYLGIGSFLWTLTACAASIDHQAALREAFPVLHNSVMFTVAEVERKGVIFDWDAVIGIQHGKEAKAYPIAVMGVQNFKRESGGWPGPVCPAGGLPGGDGAR